MSSRYYQDELNYLRARGEEYAERHPETAHMLGQGARDPDVERLLQGVAFLTARLHERLDDEFSQVAEGFLSVLWPQVLRPLPPVTMVQFSPDRQVLRREHLLHSGLELHSKRHPWGLFKFTTSRPVWLYPFDITGVTLGGRGAGSEMRFQFELNPGASLEDALLADLPIHINGSDPRFTFGWYLWLTQHVQSAHFESDSGVAPVSAKLRPVGFDDGDNLFPGSEGEISGHRLLREFFAFPEAFLSFKVDSLAALSRMGVQERFELVIDFGRQTPSGTLREIQKDSFLLHCTPAVNLFEASSRVNLDHQRSEYVLRSEEADVAHHEVYQVTEVVGTEKGAVSKKIKYYPFYAVPAGIPDEEAHVYRVRFADIQLKRDGRPLSGRECYIAFDPPDIGKAEVKDHSIAIRLQCMNRRGLARLRAGELCRPSEDVPAFVSFKNLAEPTPHHPAPRDPENLWKLVSSFAVARQSLASLEHLEDVLRLHTRHSDAVARRWLGSVSGVRVRPDIAAEGGAPLRLLKVQLDFDCETERLPEFYLFGVVLSEFLRHMATINSRLQFQLRFVGQQDLTFQWSGRRGTCVNL